MTKTLFDKIWDTHVVQNRDDGSCLLYIDRHLIHEVTSPQAFAGLQQAGRELWRIDANLATPDHNVPTDKREGTQGINDLVSRTQVEALDANCQRFGVREFGMLDDRQGIVHVIGPEQGFTLPGCTLVCGDSHTATHGAFAAIATGIGTSEVEHVLATQCLVQKKPKRMRINIVGDLQAHVGAKDVILYIISQIGTAGGTGYAIEFAGSAISSMSMEGRMTVCNMAIEAGARFGLVAVDNTTLAYVQGRPMAPTDELWQKAIVAWQELYSDDNAVFDKEYSFAAVDIAPQVTWGNSPEMCVAIDASIPNLNTAHNELQRQSWQHALEYMDLQPATPITEINLNRVFIGSCTNGRIEDLRAAAAIINGKKVAKSITQALIVPGSGLVRQQAEAEGLHTIFIEAGFEWRQAGCSMCLAMNADRLYAGEHCAATSNRNFEGRQGQGGRTHLVSPAMAAAAACAGHFVDIRDS
ncbi:MAG: 3-isopropylmalate dehydratase large subunit [Mariprofundales bacterium]